jgi:hypothetical protein
MQDTQIKRKNSFTKALLKRKKESSSSSSSSAPTSPRHAENEIIQANEIGEVNEVVEKKKKKKDKDHLPKKTRSRENLLTNSLASLSHSSSNKSNDLLLLQQQQDVTKLKSDVVEINRKLDTIITLLNNDHNVHSETREIVRSHILSETPLCDCTII